MIGLDSSELGTIPQELKEAVCNAIVNLTVARVTGSGREGEVLYGRSPRRSIFSGQLLPRFDPTGQDDETSDIRIAALGLDFHLNSQARGQSAVTPRFSVYVRVIPEWAELSDDALGMEIDFKLRQPIQDAIDNRIRHLRTERFMDADVATPDWPSLNPTQRQQVRTRRAEIQEEVRRQAYREHGIVLEAGDEQLVSTASPISESAEAIESAGDTAQDAVPPPTPPDDNPDPLTAPLRIGRLLQRGRTIPFEHLDTAPIPAKWRRIDLTFPALIWELGEDQIRLDALVTNYATTLRQMTVDQVTSWINSPVGICDVWRDLRVHPQDTVSEQAWTAFRLRAAQTTPSLPDVLPSIGGIAIQIDRIADFVDSSRVAVRIMLDNGSPELNRRDAMTRSDTIFNTSLEVDIPSEAHRPLRLDRVEPSYRFRHFLNYPAIGLNCGVIGRTNGPTLSLTTTWAPRFVQPRIIPRQLRVPLRFADFASDRFAIVDLLDVPREYERWITNEELRLREAVREGLTQSDADIESQRLSQDLHAQRREAAFVERGIRLLAESQDAYRASSNASDPNIRADLERRAAPYRAWLLTNQSFLRRERGDMQRGWRLFQLAFILAHIPTFASRMEEYRAQHDPLLDEAAASLLYFPTGGGKSEAFYGTLLFSMFLDRLRGKSRGVTAMIRYPLRLLTLQQGQRLLKLVAAAELVRLGAGISGWPFEIGFWVGGNNTPNRYAYVPSVVPLATDVSHSNDERLEVQVSGLTTDEERDASRYREFRAAYNKVPECPVCGSPTGLRRFESEGPTARRLGILCFNTRCDFNQAHTVPTALPFLLTDDTIYARAPSVILGTIDKLAMLGQRTTTIRQLMGMFGLARGIGPSGHLYSPPNEGDTTASLTAAGYNLVFPAFRSGQRVFFDPFPSLIIQDEAHLLEESLGTFSGLFDSLLDLLFREIDELAGSELGVARSSIGDRRSELRTPKIIAATATISNPERQLEVLYQRTPLRFPYPGSDIYRSFFAAPAPAPETNVARVALERDLPVHQAPERTAPWMRLFVSVMTNDSTHTVTSVAILSAFHAVITYFWRGLLNADTRPSILTELGNLQGEDEGSVWRRAAIESSIQEERENQVFALIDLHRIALAYVTNKKGGDQVMDALDAAVHQRHRVAHQPLDRFISRLISGGIDMKEIQEIMEQAQSANPGRAYPPLAQQLRSIVATSAISHGVDVDRFNSMFFAGLPSDIAEYIQASSRVGRTHVGFVLLIPTPQSRRDRYVVETHDIFHRFLERMIAPPAVERWAENAIRRVLASLVQAWAVMRENKLFVRAPDNTKVRTDCFETIVPLRAIIRNDPTGFITDFGNFVLRAIGFEGRGPGGHGRPIYQELYRSLIEQEVTRFTTSIRNFESPIRLYEYWDDSAAAFKPPMTSLRDVDEAGMIAPGAFDARVTHGRRNIDQDDLIHVMRAIRHQRGNVAETDADSPQGRRRS